MAEQNRKSDEQIRARQAAKEVVDLFLDYIVKADRIKDIGKESRHVAGMMVDFKGRIPASSGFSAICKLAGTCDRINRQYLSQDEIGAATLMALMGERQVEALCVDRALRGRTKVLAIDPFNPEEPITKHWDDDQCAYYLGTEVKTFQRRVTKGYIRLEELMGLRRQEAA